MCKVDGEPVRERGNGEKERKREREREGGGGKGKGIQNVVIAKGEQT